jgi:hypothetical protein
MQFPLTLNSPPLLINTLYSSFIAFCLAYPIPDLHPSPCLKPILELFLNPFSFVCMCMAKPPSSFNISLLLNIPLNPRTSLSPPLTSLSVSLSLPSSLVESSAYIISTCSTCNVVKEQNTFISRRPVYFVCLLY